MCCSTFAVRYGHGNAIRAPYTSYTPVYCDKLTRRRFLAQKKGYAGRRGKLNGEPPVVSSNQGFSAILGDSNEVVSKVRHKGRYRQVGLTHILETCMKRRVCTRLVLLS